MHTMYVMNMPGKLYRALQERDAFHNPSTEDQAALAVFNNALIMSMGGGSRVHLVGSKETLDYICGYIGSLAELVRHRILPAREFGVSLRELERVAQRTPVPVAT
jgi:hypothetical protein